MSWPRVAAISLCVLASPLTQNVYPDLCIVNVRLCRNSNGFFTNSIFICGSCTAEVEFEFTTWAWVQATAEMAFCGGLVVRSPGSVKALNQSTHNSLSHHRNIHSAMASHGRKFILPWPAMAEWTFRRWPRELWVDWFNALTEPGDRTTRPPQNAVSAVAWTQAQVVNSNSTSRVKETPSFWGCGPINWPVIVSLFTKATTIHQTKESIR